MSNNRMTLEYRHFRRELLQIDEENVWWVRQFIFSNGPNPRIVAHWKDTYMDSHGQFRQEELPLWIQMA